MKRTRIDYGVDLGTTNSALARMEKGDPTIKKTDVLKDTMPSCVGFNKKKSVIVGDSAINAFRSDTLRHSRTKSAGTNFFLEFKRTMGTDASYYSPESSPPTTLIVRNSASSTEVASCLRST